MYNWNEVKAGLSRLEKKVEKRHRVAMLRACIKGDKTVSEAHAFKIEQMQKIQWEANKGL